MEQQSCYHPSSTTRRELWGKLDGLTVYLWDTLTEEEKKTCNEQLEKTKDWVVWCKSNTEIDDTEARQRGILQQESLPVTKETAEKERGNKDKKEVQHSGRRAQTEDAVGGSSEMDAAEGEL